MRVPSALRSAIATLWLAAAPAAADPCEPGAGGLTVAPGFCAAVFAEDVGPVRNLVVTPGGIVVASLRDDAAGALALRDEDGDGRAERRARFGPGPAHGIALHGGHLYLAAEDRVVRWPWTPDQLEPAVAPEVLVQGFPDQGSHELKGLALDPDGTRYVSIGAPSNACQERARTPRSPGLDPCPQLEAQAGVWRFPADGAAQAPTPERRFATGLRHTLALAVHPGTGELWGVVNGRDQLGQLWGWSAERNAELPAEELVHLEQGKDFGWPYCFMDGVADRKVLAPEYGGDGTKVGRCGGMAGPALSFPAHWAPMAIVFASAKTAQGLPDAYRDGAFVAFRGSWNRAPLPQQGYRVVYAPFRAGRPTGEFQTFAIGARSPTETRMTGVALGPDGSVYVAADANGTIWRVTPTSAP